MDPSIATSQLITVWRQLLKDARSNLDVINTIKNDVLDLIATDKTQNDIQVIKTLAKKLGSCADFKIAVLQGDDGYIEFRNKLNIDIYRNYIETPTCWCGIEDCADRA
jgi:hypothetical protein